MIASLFICISNGCFFHADCAGLHDHISSALHKCDALSWRCEDCKKNSISDVINGVRGIESSLKTNFNILQEQYSTLRNSITNKPNIPRYPLLGETPRSSKRPRYSPTLTHTPLKVGRSFAAVTSCTGAVADEFKTATPQVETKKFLYVSNIHRDAQQQGIKSYVARMLNIDKSEILCHKLVKMNVDISNFKYISFKIGVAAGLFDLINNPENWPAGMRINEFINRRPTNYREPDVEPAFQDAINVPELAIGTLLADKTVEETD